MTFFFFYTAINNAKSLPAMRYWVVYLCESTARFLPHGTPRQLCAALRSQDHDRGLRRSGTAQTGSGLGQQITPWPVDRARNSQYGREWTDHQPGGRNSMSETKGA